MTWAINFIGHPATVNQLLGNRWRAHRLKARDRAQICIAVNAAGVPQATGKRKVSIDIMLAPKKRAADPDAYWKSLLDALVQCGVLKDDNRQHVILGPVEFLRSTKAWTRVLVEDVTP